MKRVAIVAGVAWLALALGSAVHAAPITLGLFAPSAPFPSTAERVELANRLGAELGKALNAPGSGRVYARAADFAAAVKRGEVTLALVDPVYLASPAARAASSFAVIAVALAADAKAERTWQLVARGGAKLTELKGKRVLVPSLGGRKTEFVINVLLGGEVGRDFFAKIDPAPDTASALAALELGKADATVVPVTGELPAGTAEVLLPALSNPVLVVYGGIDRAAVLAAALGFKSDSPIAGFSAADGRIVSDLASRFHPPAKRGPFLIPATRLVVGDLIEGRRFAIERTPVTSFVIAPATR